MIKKAIPINIFSWIIIIVWIIIIPISFNFWDKQILWDISWWSVVFIMIIRPLSNIFSRFIFLKKMIFFRKAFWILSSSIVITFLVYKHLSDPWLITQYFSLANWSLYNPIFSRISEITWLILLVTSNTYSQVKLWKWWKKIQRLSYLYFFSGTMIVAIWEPLKAYTTIWVVLLLWILAKLKIKILK